MNLTKLELESKLFQTKESMFQARMSNSNGTLKNPLKIRSLRRKIARIKTLLNNIKDEAQVLK
ncbi:MAG: 50S ribosomal protein L29 [bacterium]